MSLKLEDSALKELARCNPKGYLELLGVFDYLKIQPDELNSLQTEFLDYKSKVSKVDSVIDLKSVIAHIENQSTNLRVIDFIRIGKYHFELVYEHEKDVLTVITCSDIPKKKITELKILDISRFTPLIVYFQEMDGKKILNNIISKVENVRNELYQEQENRKIKIAELEEQEKKQREKDNIGKRNIQYSRQRRSTKLIGHSWR